MLRATILRAGVLLAAVFVSFATQAWEPLPVSQDPLVRMPGTQPGQVLLEGPSRCTNCHEGYNQAVEPGFNWKGSMMAQASRDPLFWATFTVAAQDSIHVLGNPNAADLCLRCHFPKGWLEGRSDTLNASAMTGADHDGVQCDFCHRMYDPHFADTYSGEREGNDRKGYWDEAGTLSGAAAQNTYNADLAESGSVSRFDGAPFFVDGKPFSQAYDEAGSGQYFVAKSDDKRASFADAQARHRMLYSRFHKSKYFCASCHDVSNAVLANSRLTVDGPGLPSEALPSFSFFHVERTFSEFMLSAYGRQGGAPGIGPFAPGVFKTSTADNNISRCQDCHMRDGVGQGAGMRNAVIRPAGSSEHPNSGQPIHDLTGGNIWVPTILASTISGSPNYDATNAALLRQGPGALTLDLTQGLGVDSAALLAGVERARQQLELAAEITSLAFADGTFSFRIQNQTGHKLISGFPEGRRMFVNIRAFDSSGKLIHEINPYDGAAATLKGLAYSYRADASLPVPAEIGPDERYVDALVYETKPGSDITKEATTFHFVLGTERYKDNRIPPKGFDISAAAARESVPVWQGSSNPDYFTPSEYGGGYDEVSVSLPLAATRIEVNLYYQTTSREYIEFLRDEISGTGNRTLPDTAYIAQADPFFAGLKAWGDTIWQLWLHNRNAAGAAPYLMARATLGVGGGGEPPPAGCEAPAAPGNLAAVSGGNRSVPLSWDAVVPPFTGYNIYYDQAGKLLLVASVPEGTNAYTDRQLKQRTQYCYAVTAVNACGDVTMESAPSGVACATTK